MRALNRHNPGLDAELFKGGFQFLNQGFFNLSLRIHDPTDQPFTQSADALAHQFSGVGDFNNQHTNRCGWTATLSAVRLENFFEITQLGGRDQLGKRELTGASR